MYKKRKHIRFKLDDSSFAKVDYKDSVKEISLYSLVVNESYTGCCLITTTELNEKENIIVTIGQLAPLKGEIKWVKKIDESVYKLGIEYLNK